MQTSNQPRPRLIVSNRLEALVEQLCAILEAPLSSPMAEETIVVQSQGMAHWLSMQLARRLGICANVRFPFPNALVEELFRKVMPGIPESSPFEPGVMTWRIMKVLGGFVNAPGVDSLKAYLGRGDDPLKALQLADRIADTFDQYLLFRPEMMLAWEAGDEAHWQAELWRRIRADAPPVHRAALAKRFFEAIHALPEPPPGFPERVAVFGISALPPFHLHVLRAAARWTELNVFLLNPSREFWGDVVSEREAGRLSRRSARPVEHLHLEGGNSLLASMGTLGRDFLDLLQEQDLEETACFEPEHPSTLLGRVQGDILALREGFGEVDAAGRPVKRQVVAGDDSIQIHACHGPLREMEVLHDVLLDLFERDPRLAPSDVLVMAPDIEAYAPYIRAVFDQPDEGASPKIPFSIADQGLRREGRLVEPFLAILALAGGRFRAGEVLEVLECPAVLAAFDFEEGDLGLIRRWVRESGVRWGIDGENRREKGLPAFPENTWQSGLERLLLGYAMPGQGEALFEGILPYDELEGSEAAVLGSLAEFLDRLFGHARGLGRPRPLEDWSRDLGLLLDTLFRPSPEDETEMTVIREALHRFSSDAGLAGFEDEVDVRTIRWVLARSFGRQGFGYGFMSGGVTFCAMLPMRSVPFKVICLTGLDHDAFPRSLRPPGFDLMAARPRRGDRSRRNDDRYLFLETLLSARRNLILTYVGRSARDNSPIPPSVLVMELLDYLETHFEPSSAQPPRGPEAAQAGGAEGEGAARMTDLCLTTHHLQAFHPEYFTNEGRLFSYGAAQAAAARRLQEDRRPPGAFITGPLLDEAGAVAREWTIEELKAFVVNPARFLLQRRLDLVLEEPETPLEDRELFELGGLERYQLRMDILSAREAGRDPARVYSAARAAGRLPHGPMGRAFFEAVEGEAAAFWEKTGPYLAGGPSPPLDVDLFLGGCRLTGRLGAVYPQGLVHYRAARLKARDRLRLWIEHLAWHSLAEADPPKPSVLAALEKRNKALVWTGRSYTPPEDASELLAKLLAWLQRGLERPLPFFPESSMAFAEGVLKRGDRPEAALERARRQWEEDAFSKGECSDPYFDLCFGSGDPLDEAFEDLAVDLCGPLLEHEEVLS
ncbi:DNA helicase/exodeoxyribonuclease V, gamma subunit [uncultured Desulfatiglans sp.]|uniref:DNA helicase/exodeoxyribonuclease V, gamma subunit n=1 Tax=Uncultured Desulfatiglans sp. TaxID=1748965 RepID=A0A653A798_UNCDX|nr:DNA helicase/exodeoxyribonuclease V, gamma subunit [uncultured Desulfatiglans sp.]